MPKILQISIEVNSGSVGRIAEQIGEVVIEKGWSSYITYARNNNPSSSQAIKIGNSFDIYRHGLETRLFDNHCFSSKTATFKLIEKIREIQPDIIHLHHLHGYFINIEILFNFLKGSKIPVVWTFHDCWSFTGHCVYFDFVGCEKWKTGCNNCPQTKEYPASLFIDRSKENYLLKKDIFTSVDKMIIVPVSNWLGGLVKESFLQNYPIKVIQNGVDINIFQPISAIDRLQEKLNVKENFVILGVASPWVKRKGLNDFVELSELLKNDCSIILVGLNKKQLNNLPSNIIGLPRTESPKHLAKLYSLSDVFVNPTYEDTFPTTNLEAMACGTPVITYSTGGSVESITHETGLVVEKGDVISMLQAITTIKEKGKSTYSNLCRGHAEKYFNKEDRFKEYLNLYKDILKDLTFGKN